MKTVTKKRVTQKKTATKKSATSKLTQKKIEELKKDTKSPYGWRALIGIGLVNGKRPKRTKKPDKDIIWGD